MSRRVHNSYRIKDTTKRMYYWRSRSTDYCWLTKLILRDSLQDHTVVFRFHSKITAGRTSREGSNGVSELEREIQSSRANMVQFLNFRKDSTEKTHCAKQRFCRKSAYREHAAISVTLYSYHVEKMKKRKERRSHLVGLRINNSYRIADTTKRGTIWPQESNSSKKKTL